MFFPDRLKKIDRSLDAAIENTKVLGPKILDRFARFIRYRHLECNKLGIDPDNIIRFLCEGAAGHENEDDHNRNAVDERGQVILNALGHSEHSI